MADVTISQLTQGTPIGNSSIPFSTGTSTNRALISALPVDYSSIVNSPSRACITYDLASGTAGGSAAASSWTSRSLNTIIYNQNNIVKDLTLGRRWWLGAGNYILEAEGIFFNDNNSQNNAMHRILKVEPTAAVVAGGLSVRSHLATGSSGAYSSKVTPTLVSLSELSSFELQYWLSGPRGNSYDLGFPVSSGLMERYAQVYITKV